MKLVAEVIQIFDGVTYLPNFGSNLQSALDETVTVPWFSTVLAAGIVERSGIEQINYAFRIEIYRPTVDNQMTYLSVTISNSCSPSHNNSRLVDVLVGICTGRWQTNRDNKFVKSHRCVQCYDGDVIGLIRTKSEITTSIIIPFLCSNNLHRWRRCIGREGRLYWSSSSFGRWVLGSLHQLKATDQSIRSRQTTRTETTFIHARKKWKNALL